METPRYIEHFLILASAVTGCISIYDFAPLVGIAIETEISAIGLKSFEINAGIKMRKSIIKKNKKKYEKKLLLAKTLKNYIA